MNSIKKFISRYNNMSRPVKAALWFTICSFLQRGVSMITTPIFSRILPTEEYGLYSTYLSWESVLLMIVSLSLYKSIMNLYNKHDNKEAVLSSVCGLEIIICTFWLIIGFIFRNEISNTLKLSPKLVICLFLFFVFQSVFQCWALYKRYIYDYIVIVVVTLLLTVGSATLGVVMTIIDPKAESRAISAVVVLSGIGIYLCIDVFRKSLKFYDKAVWTFALGFCIPLLPHYLSEFVLQSSDKIMINYMCGASDVAVYSIAYSVGSLIGLVTNSINSSFAPYQYQKLKTKEYKFLAKRANQVLAFVGIMLVLIMLFSREVVLIFGGKKYLQSADVVIPICLGVYFSYMFQLFARVQEFYEGKITVVIPSILCAVLNLALNYIFIQIYGYQAAAYTTFVSYFIFCILHYFFYRNVCKHLLSGEQPYNIKGIIIISLVVILTGVIVAFVNQFIVIKYLIIFVGLILCVVFRKKIFEYSRMIREKE